MPAYPRSPGSGVETAGLSVFLFCQPRCLVSLSSGFQPFAVENFLVSLSYVMFCCCCGSRWVCGFFWNSLRMLAGEMSALAARAAWGSALLSVPNIRFGTPLRSTCDWGQDLPSNLANPSAIRDRSVATAPPTKSFENVSPR